MRIPRRTLVISTVVLAAAGTSAFAYVTTSGHGQGSTTTAAVKPLKIDVTQPASLGIGESGDVTFAVTNDNKGTVRVKNIQLAVTAPSGCPSGSFTLDDGSQKPASSLTYTLPDPGVAVAPGGPVAIPSKVVLKFADLPNDNQDACINGKAIVTADIS